MTFHISRRSFVRIITFALAGITILAFMSFSYSRSAAASRRALEYQYMKSVSDLGAHLQNIDSDLSKILVAGTPQMLSAVSSKLWRESGFAKDLISGLPIQYLDLQNTNKFLSQVGDYCVSISREAAGGAKIDAEQRKNLKSLKEYSQTMLSEVLAVADAVQTGSLSLIKAEDNLNHEFDGGIAPANIAEGFNDFEEGFTAYPTLIYDGPFSDHIMQKEPEKIKGANNITKSQAKAKVSEILELPSENIEEGNDEDSKLPSYVFYAGDTSVSITKKGGYLSYLLKSRMVDEPTLSDNDAISRAMAFLNKLGIMSMQSTYYEISNNVLTVNLAYSQDGILMYTDLIKIGVALDNGEILSFDARGFLVNNHSRSFDTPKLTQEQAQESLSPELSVESAQLCVIPSGGLNEIFCYEFKCSAFDNQPVLVYVNANTGSEEQILLLLISENGQLTI